MAETLILHEHSFASGPRSGGHYEKGKWHDGKIRHSHPGGEIPHTHENTGPACYGYRHKFSKRPTGEQLGAAIPRSEEDNTFDLVIADTAHIGVEDGFVPVGNTPIEEITTPAADRMVRTFGMKCNVIDMRTPGYVPPPTDINGRPWSKKKVRRG
jgi:hypothetical protein